MPSFTTYQPNSAVDIKVRKVVELGKTPGEITTADNRVIRSLRADNSTNTGAKSYLKVWDSNTTPTQDATAPNMIIPAGPGKSCNMTCLEGHLASYWTAGIFTNITATKASGNTSSEVQADPGVLVTMTMEHGA